MDRGEIYCLTHSSNKKYISQCVKVLSNGRKWGYLNRWQQHITKSSNGRDYCGLLNNAIRKYKPENFTIEPIQDCDIKDLDYYENLCIEKFNTMTPNGYNLITGKPNSRHSDETKKLQRKSTMGKNLGKVLEKCQRLKLEDVNLPKYIRHYKDSIGKEEYRVNNHPHLKDRSFVSKYDSMEENYKWPTITRIHISVRYKMKVQRVDGSWDLMMILTISENP